MVQSLPPLSILSPTTGPYEGGGPLSSARVALQIISAPVSSRDGTAPIHLKGEITRVNPDNTIIVETDRGPVTARLPENVRAQAGQQVEIEIMPPARPDKGGPPPPQATLRAAPPEGGASTRPAPSASTSPVTSVPVQVREQINLNTQLRELSQRSPSQHIALSSGQTLSVRPVTLAQVISMMSGAETATSPPLTTTLPKFLALAPPATLQNAALPVSVSAPLSASFVDQILSAPSLMTASFSYHGIPKISSPGISPTTFPVDLALSSRPATSKISLNIFAELPSPLSLRSLNLASFSWAQSMTVQNVAHAPSVFLASPETPLGQGPLYGTGFFSSLSHAGFPSLTVIAQNPLGYVVFGQNGVFGTEPPFLFQSQSPFSPINIGSTIIATPLGSGPRPQDFLSRGPALGLDQARILISESLNDLIDALDFNLRGALFGPTGRPPVPNMATPQQLGASMFLFLSVLRSGDISGWLSNPALDALRRTPKGSQALHKLTSALESVRQNFMDAPVGEWRSLPLPLQWQNTTFPAQVHIRSEQENPNDPENQKKGQRFVLDLTFDRMGAVQMDMLYQPGRLDSILRTELPLSIPMRGVLEAKYAGAMGKTGLTGVLNFQDGPASWVTVQGRGPDMRVTA